MKFVACLVQILLACSYVMCQVDPSSSNALTSKSSQDAPMAVNSASGQQAQGTALGQGNGQLSAPAQGQNSAPNPFLRPPDVSAVVLPVGGNNRPPSPDAKALQDGVTPPRPEVRVEVPTEKPPRPEVKVEVPTEKPPTPEVPKPTVETPDVKPSTPEPGTLEKAIAAFIETAALKSEYFKNSATGQLELQMMLNELKSQTANATKSESQDHQKAEALLQRLIKEIELEKMSNAIDCSDFFLAGVRQNGIYSIKPTKRKLPFEVYCDQEKDGGGWTFIQRRGDYGQPNDYFYKNWTEYKRGFGPLDQEFWLGNEQIKDITSQGQYSLRINMRDYDNEYIWAEYLLFSVGSEVEQYQLKISGFTSNSNFDSMAFHDLNKFSTYDVDNDKSLKTSCAEDRKGGWWYSNCANANLNGAKAEDPANSTLTWYVEGKGQVPMKSVEMKIRPKGF